ncbi:MAG: NADH-quinone oxidoreductase subunit E [Rhodospirillaceae bacterium TMED8]|nr:NADH-quinone oxidoreductase subunit NuoE [Magnetovibrio sp.]OUT51693.1 MAG: NADH-quinone oxidoreductase subunit E [Rhodospirillaceae bacterium TMED8]|tara:strand:- start:204 stop:824 length:621 start_codon:yes stop_codon:yes gene_type:complete
MRESGKEFSFNEDTEAMVQSTIAKYPKGWEASAVMPLLDLAQRQNHGWLSKEAIDYVSQRLNMPPIRVYEVATFYTMYNLEPIGKHHVEVCTNLPCWLRGSDDIVAACEKALNITMGETTEDKTFTLSHAECLGACVNAPMMQIDDEYYEDLDTASTISIIDALKAGKTPKNGSQSARFSCEPATGLTSLKHQEALLKSEGNGGSL